MAPCGLGGGYGVYERMQYKPNLKMNAVLSPEMLVNAYQTTRCHRSRDDNTNFAPS